jgi:hypothetical protein
LQSRAIATRAKPGACGFCAGNRNRAHFVQASAFFTDDERRTGWASLLLLVSQEAARANVGEKKYDAWDGLVIWAKARTWEV